MDEMKFSYFLPDGRKVDVNILSDGTLEVTGAGNVNIRIPLAYRGRGLKAFPHGVEGEMRLFVSVQPEESAVHLGVNSDAPVVIPLKDANTEARELIY